VIDQRLQELGIVLPPVFPPAGNYLGCVIDNDIVYVGGHGPIDGETVIRGKVGGQLSLEEGRQAARLTALSILATLRADLGDLDRIARIVKVYGMVNVAPGFNQTPRSSMDAPTCSWRSSVMQGVTPVAPSVSRSCPSTLPWRSS
jgi:enamine deaminase RidA (YjgF/YER057c/UK114 family)